MNEKQKILSLQFWFLVMTSLFLVVTFVLYLPLRFQHSAGEEPHDESGMMHEDEMTMHDEDVHSGTIYHEEADVREGIAVSFNFAPALVGVGSSTRLDFFVNRKPGGISIPTQELEFEHEKLMHTIGVRNDMEEFFHIHPEPSATTTGLLSADYGFQKPGLYKVWSEIRQDGVIHAFGHPEFNVEGDGERHRKQVSFANNVIAGDYQVHLDHPQPLRAGVESDLEFSIRDLFGRPVEVEPYLAADIHLSIIKDDLKRFIHTHPVRDEHHNNDSGFIPFADVGAIPFSEKIKISNGAHPDDDHHDAFAPRLIPVVLAHGEEGETGEEKIISFHVTFPEPGLYRVFAQFRPVGTDLPPDEALTAAFWLRLESPPKFAPSQGLLVTISIILILILSFGMKKYLTTRI